MLFEFLLFRIAFWPINFSHNVYKKICSHQFLALLYALGTRGGVGEAIAILDSGYYLSQVTLTGLKIS